MHACTQAGIAHQLFGGGKPRDVPDGGQQHERVDHADARHLQQEHHLAQPGFGPTQARQFLLHLRNQRLEARKYAQVLANAQLLYR